MRSASERIKRLTVMFIVVSLFSSFLSPASALPLFEEQRNLLQKGLNLYEIERELSRLNEEEKRLEEQLALLNENLLRQQEQVEKTRERAGKVLRIYYRGERTQLVFSLFHLRELNDLWLVLHYLKAIFTQDRNRLEEYAKAYREMKQTQEQLRLATSELREIKAEFIKRREEMIRLEKEVQQLAQNPGDMEQIKELTEKWEKTGITWFKNYFQALSDAMLRMDEMFVSERLIVDGKFQITDGQLNEFLRSQNKIFEDFSFRFETEKLIAKGEKEGNQVQVVGHYWVENEEVNAVRFQIDELLFNGFSLPETTVRELNEQFDLSFYPQNIISFIRVTDVRMEPGKLTAELKLEFGF